jgi:hypothetical protein
MGQHAFGQALAQVVPLLDGCHIVLVQRRADQQAHAPTVVDQLDDAGCGGCQRRGAEEAGRAVVAHAGRERRDVKVDQRLVCRGVIDAEGVIAERWHEKIRILLC